MDKAQKMHLPLPGDFNFAECCWFLDRGYDDCVHRVKDGKITKALKLDEQELLIEIAEGRAAWKSLS